MPWLWKRNYARTQKSKLVYRIWSRKIADRTNSEKLKVQNYSLKFKTKLRTDN